MPLFLDSATSSIVAIGPLLFEVLLAAYLVIHYLHLRGLVRFIAYFIAYVGLIAVPSGILGPLGAGQSYLSSETSSVNPITNNSTVSWLNNYDNDCLLVTGQTSTVDSTGYYGLGYGGASSGQDTDCHGVALVTAEAYSSGIGSKANMQSSVWFMDQPFFVPDHGQKTTRLDVGGEVFVSGWLARQGAGIGLYDGSTSLEIGVRLIGTAPCNAYDCYSSYSVVRSWTGTQWISSSEYQFSALTFYVHPGHSYNIIVSFNETSSSTGMGPGGVAGADVCFGYSPYCVMSPYPAVKFSCSPNLSPWPSCGLVLKALSYSLTDFQR